MHWPCQNCVYVTFAWRNRTRDDESYLNDAVPFCLSDFTELLISDGRKSKAWVMPSSGIASRRDRDSQLLVLKAFGEGTISYSGDKLHIPPQESVLRCCQRWALIGKTAKCWTYANGHDVYGSQQFLLARGASYTLERNPLWSGSATTSVFNSPSLFHLPLCDLTPKESEKSHPAFFGCSSHPLVFSSLSRNGQCKWILVVFLFRKQLHA